MSVLVLKHQPLGRIIRGGNGLCDGALGDLNPDTVLQTALARDFGHVQQAAVLPAPQETMVRLSYAHTFGPTTGDKVSVSWGNTLLAQQQQ